MSLVRATLSIAVLATALASTALAQGTGRSLDIDLSIRSAGAGGASNAIFWGGDPNYWANPALLGYHRGTSWLWGKTQLVPDLASDVFMKSSRVTFGVAGIGVATAGDGLGKIQLDYGSNEGRDESGNPTGTFRSFEDIDSWAMGLSLSGLVDAIAGLSHREPPSLTRYFDLALGYASKEVLIALAPDFIGGTSGGTGKDHGLLLRVSPVVRESGMAIGGLPLQVDLAYGWSVLNANDERVVFLNEDAASPLTRSHRNGLATRIALDWPKDAARNSPLHWLIEGLEPLLAVGVSRDWEHNSAGGVGSFYDVDRLGYELVLANVLAFRTGHMSDEVGAIEGATTGWGAGFRLGRVAGFRYDWATIPQASGFEDVDRKGFTAFVDVTALFPGSAGRDAKSW